MCGKRKIKRGKMKVKIFSVCILILLSCTQKKTEMKLEPEIKKEEILFTPSPEELYEKGIEEMKKFTSLGYKNSIEYLEKAIQLDCKFYKAYPALAKAYALFAKERKEMGLENFSEWLKAQYYIEKGMGIFQSSDLLKAQAILLVSKNFMKEREYREAFQSGQSLMRRKEFKNIDKDMVISYMKDLFHSSFMRDDHKAIEILDKILKENPEDMEASLFKWWIGSPGYEESEEIKKFMEEIPDCSLPYFEIGIAKKKGGEMEEAEKWLKEALERNPEHPRALSELGEIYMEKEDFDRGIEFFKKGIALDDELPKAHFNLGFIYQELGEYEKALNHYKRASEIKPDMEEVFYQASLILIEESKWNDAIEILNSLIELHGSFEIFGYTLSALSKFMLGKLEEAESDSNQATEINPSFDIPYYILGLISFKKEKWNEATGRFLQAIKYNKNFDDAHYFLGQTYLKLKKKKLAKNELEKAQALFLLQINEMDKKIKVAEEKGLTKKLERLNRRKKDIQEKISQCNLLLNGLR